LSKKNTKISQPDSPPDRSSATTAAAPRRAIPVWAFVILLVYAAGLLYQRRSVPPGMNNDVAEEALRGLYLVEGHHFEAMTFAVGNSAETLFLYLTGAVAQVLGPTTLAIQIVSWLFGLACVWLIWKLVERITDTVPAWIPLLGAGGSLWLFHYSRSGLRAITAPFFLAAFALLLDQAERRSGDRRVALLCGAVMGLSLYGYTSSRAIPLAFLVYAALRLIRESARRAALIRRYAMIVAGAAIASIPNLILFLQHPKEFLSRGDYVLAGSTMDYAVNLLWSALLPLYYPDNYRHIQFPHYRSDGVAAGLVSAGHNPVQIVIGIAFVIGLARVGRYLGKPVAVFLICTWIVAILALGITGPSATRMLILVPVYLVFAALGFGWVLETRPQLRMAVLALLLQWGPRGHTTTFLIPGNRSTIACATTRRRWRWASAPRRWPPEGSGSCASCREITAWSIT
jgi:hypothetical protein